MPNKERGSDFSRDFLYSDIAAEAAPENCPRVRALSTTRGGGASAGPYRSLNLATHVGDEYAVVERNRALLCDALRLPAEPAWLEQVHGADVLELNGEPPLRPADAAFTRRPGVVLAVLTADCLPVVLAAVDGSAVAVAHAGWRGLAAGVIDATVRAMGIAPARLRAWLGPAISADAYEVGDEVRTAFVAADPDNGAAFGATRPGHWRCDLYTLARRQLVAAGVTAVSGGGWCTYSDASRFFSYRRDGRCGRMATLAWLAPRQRGKG
jgi:YfiH family protein